MDVDRTVLIAILGMALVTAATRLGGFWLADRIARSPRIDAMVTLLPGAILISIVAPAVIREGVSGVLATLAAVLVMHRTGNVLLTLIIGVGAIWLLREVI